MASSSSSPEIPAPHSNHNHHNHRNSSLSQKLQECLEDLSSRFILNLPEVELASLERVCFQVEQAHWYYEDFIRDEDPSFPSMTLKKFSHSLFGVCPLLKHFGHDHEQAFQSFLAYKTRVPVCGAIMLNESWDKCLLVKGWKSTAAWSFPKGKINEQEPKFKCAIREVLEETGYDLESDINPDDMVDYSPSGEQSVSLFIVPNIPEDYPFATRTRKEISKIAWFRLTDLPTWKRNKVVPGKFYLIAPFIGPLKAYIRDHKPQNVPRKPSRAVAIHAAPRPGPASDTESPTPVHSLPAPLDPGSSSHSSDVDNAEPPTPSPQYSAPIVDHSALSLNGLNAVSENEQTISPDSHLAFLLSSLTKSALPTPAQETAEPPKPRSHTSQVELMPATRPSPSEVSAPLQSPSNILSDVRPSPPPSRSSNTHASSPSTGPHSSVSFINAAAGSAPPISPRTARRNQGLSADISPYFTRPAPAAIPKQMKYLTMLENVAKESERMTPKLERQMQVMNALLPLQPPSRTPGHHEPDARTVLPSHPPGPSVQAGPTFPLGFIPNPSHHDPFTVRPRTSNTYHPVQYPTHLPRASMNDEHLRFMMAGTSVRPPRAHISEPMPYPSSHPRMGSSTGLAGGPPPETFQMVPPQLSQTPLRVVPPHYLLGAPINESGPLSAPPLSPSFTIAPRPNPANNAHLLSILNAPSIPRAVTSVPRATMGGHA